MQVAAGLKALHAMYGAEFMAALKRCMEQDAPRARTESTAEKWMALLQSVQAEDAKKVRALLAHGHVRSTTPRTCARQPPARSAYQCYQWHM